MYFSKFWTESRQWTLLFVFLCQLVYASPELILLGMALSGAWIFYRDRKQMISFVLMMENNRALWLVPMCFVSVFFIKLVSSIWAFTPKEAIDSAFNNVHFLLWPGVVIYLRKSGVSLRRAEPWMVASMVVLMFWYLGARLFFPESEDAQCFKAGGHNCGLLGHTLAFMLLWLFLAVTRPYLSVQSRSVFFLGLIAGWIAFLGTGRRTEMLGLIVGMLGVLIWRFKGSVTVKKSLLMCGIFAVILTLAWPVMAPRFAVVENEVVSYMQGGQARINAAQTSVGARLEMYRIALESIRARPWLGWGAGLKPRHVSQFALDPQNPYGYSNFHQQYLQTVLEIGLGGTLLVVAILIYLIKQTIIRPWQSGQKELAALVIALYFTYAWKGLAYASLGYSLPNAIFVFFSAWFWVAMTQNKKTASFE